MILLKNVKITRLNRKFNNKTFIYILDCSEEQMKYLDRIKAVTTFEDGSKHPIVIPMKSYTDSVRGIDALESSFVNRTMDIDVDVYVTKPNGRDVITKLYFRPSKGDNNEAYQRTIS